VADECWKPWNIAQKFVVNSILEQENEVGVIYFTFTRPHYHIRKQLEAIILKEHHKITDASLLFNNLIIIDCFTPLSLENIKKHKI